MESQPKGPRNWNKANDPSRKWHRALYVGLTRNLPQEIVEERNYVDFSARAPFCSVRNAKFVLLLGQLTTTENKRIGG